MNCRTLRKVKSALEGGTKPIMTEALAFQIPCEEFVRNLLAKSQWRKSGGLGRKSKQSVVLSDQIFQRARTYSQTMSAINPFTQLAEIKIDPRIER